MTMFGMSAIPSRWVAWQLDSHFLSRVKGLSGRRDPGFGALTAAQAYWDVIGLVATD